MPEGNPEQGATQELTLDKVLEKFPDLKTRLEAGDAATTKLAEAEAEAARKRGDVDKLLKTEQDDHGKTRSKLEAAEAKVKSYERREKVDAFVKSQKDLKVPLAAVHDTMNLLDDGKLAVEELFKQAVAKVESWGVSAQVKQTDALEAGGGGANRDGDPKAARLAELVELGAKALKSNKPLDKQAYNNLRAKLEAEGVKIGPDVARKIATAAGVS